MEGHLLIVTKDHINCFLNLDNKINNEFIVLKRKTINFLKNNYLLPVIFEHGVAGQTVPHAHMHFLPTKKLIYDDLKRFGNKVNKPTIPYLYFEYKKLKTFYKPSTYITPGLIHSTIYPQKLGRPLVGTDRAKNLAEWLPKVKKNFNS